MQDELDKFVYNNEEEAEMGQIHALHINENALARIRAQLPTGPSYSHCDECGEEIPEARRLAIRGCKTCIDCQTVSERMRRTG
jgi:phage/conjugal plasmid C-4 type zinc finger TraR family protein